MLGRLGVPLLVLVVGTSQGGSIAACFAATHPGAASRLALLAPFFDRVPGQEGVGYRLMVTPVVGDVLFGLVGDRKLADVSDSIVSADIRAALQPTVFCASCYPVSSTTRWKGPDTWPTTNSPAASTRY